VIIRKANTVPIKVLVSEILRRNVAVRACMKKWRVAEVFNHVRKHLDLLFLLPLFQLSDLWEQNDAYTLGGHSSHHNQYFLLFVSCYTHDILGISTLREIRFQPQDAQFLCK